MSKTISCSICISDLDKSDYNTGKNGKVYLNFNVGERREVSEWFHTHYIKNSLTKAQKEAGKESKYIGDGKEKIWDNGGGQAQAPVANDFSKESDDLPF